MYCPVGDRSRWLVFQCAISVISAGRTQCWRPNIKVLTRSSKSNLNRQLPTNWHPSGLPQAVHTNTVHYRDYTILQEDVSIYEHGWTHHATGSLDLYNGALWCRRYHDSWTVTAASHSSCALCICVHCIYVLGIGMVITYNFTIIERGLEDYMDDLFSNKVVPR